MRWVPLVVVLAVLIPSWVGMWVWLSNTEELTVVDAASEPVGPGGSIAVSLRPVGSCTPGFERLYRERFGRWQLTHTFNADGLWVRDEVRLWSRPEMHAYFSVGSCYVGGAPVTLTIPENVTWSPVVACPSRGACVRIEVDTQPANP